MPKFLPGRAKTPYRVHISKQASQVKTTSGKKTYRVVNGKVVAVPAPMSEKP